MEWSTLICNISFYKDISALEKCKREDELMSYLWAHKIIRKLASLWLEDLYDRRELKSLVEARNFKKVGNKEFQEEKYVQSIESYTKSAMYSPIGTDELSVAIANRSASLFYLHKYDDCIKDIELAMKFNYPKKLHYKLYLRAAQCYVKLDKQNLAKEMLYKIYEIINNPEFIVPSMKDDIEKRISEIKLTESCEHDNKQTESELLNLESQIKFNENPDFLGASTSIDRVYDKELGRRVIANRFIKKGEVLFFEKPTAFVLVHSDEELNYLCHCCNHLNTNTPVPCAKCLNTLYCNTKCSDDAWSLYHRWECIGSQINLWKQIGVGHLALKNLLICSTTTDIIKFNETQNLITNFEKQSAYNLAIHGSMALMLTIYLMEYTDFLKEININDCLVKKFSENTRYSNFNISTNDNKRIYLSSLLLRHILQVISNGQAISNTQVIANPQVISNGSYPNQTFIPSKQQNITGVALYPSASMMNHSCDPNILMIFVDQYLICKALVDIAVNEEVLNCYGVDYRYTSRKQRQELLESQYFFTCKCKHCILQELQYFVERFDAMKCTNCNGALCHIEESLKCLDCHVKPKSYCQSKIEKCMEVFEAAETSIASGEMEDALDKLKEYLYISRNILYKYNETITTTLNNISRIYYNMGQWENSILHLEDTIPAVIERFGPSSPEFATLVLNLLSIYVQYLCNYSGTRSKKFRNMHEKAQKYVCQVVELTKFYHGSWSHIYKQLRKHKIIISNIPFI